MTYSTSQLRMAAAGVADEDYTSWSKRLYTALQEVGYSQEQAIALVGRFFLEVPNVWLYPDSADRLSRQQLKRIIEKQEERPIFQALDSKKRAELFGDYAIDVDLRRLSTYYVLLRSFYLDGEAIAEDPASELTNWLPFLFSQGVILKVESSPQKTAKVVIKVNGRDVEILNGTEGESSWYEATRNLIGLVNCHLKQAGSVYRLLMIDERASFVSDTTRQVAPWNEIDVHYLRGYELS